MHKSPLRSPAQKVMVLTLLLILAGLNSVWVQAAPRPQQGACAIEGYVFNDLDSDGELDPGEPGLATTLNLLPAEGSDDPLVTRTSNAGDGFFCFEEGLVPDGRYRLRQEKVTGFEPTGGQERVVTIVAGRVTEVLFPNVEVQATPTNAPSPTIGPDRNTPTPAPTFTFTATSLPSPTQTGTPAPPTATVPASATPSVTVTPSQSATPSLTATTTRTPTLTPTGTLRPLTPIATFITTTPGVLVTTTRPGGPINNLPTTGSGSDYLLTAGVLALVMMGAGVARRLFFRS